MASFDKAISPGQEGNVTLKISTHNKQGKVKQSATVYSNDPQQPTTKITLSGIIKPYVRILPSQRVSLTGYYGENAQQTLTITSLTDEPLIITDISSSIEDKIKYELKTEKKEKEYSLEIKTLSGIEEVFRGSIMLTTNSQKKPKIAITVMASVKKEIRVAPDYLYFGIIDTNKKDLDKKSLQRTTVISQMRTDDLTIETIETSTDWIKTEIDTNQEGKQYTVTISLDKDKLPQGKFREIISIHTQSKGKPEVAKIIVEGKVL